MVFGIGYGDDVEHAREVLMELVKAHEKVLDDPEPVVEVGALGESSVDFIVRPWTKTEDYWAVFWDLTRERSRSASTRRRSRSPSPSATSTCTGTRPRARGTSSPPTEPARSPCARERRRTEPGDGLALLQLPDQKEEHHGPDEGRDQGADEAPVRGEAEQPEDEARRSRPRPRPPRRCPGRRSRRPA